MGIITIRSDDPLYRLNQIYDDIYSAKYPNEASVINDPLRGTIQNLYGCNLNMYDTHKIQFARPQGGGVVNTGMAILEPDTFYVYEGSGNNLLFTPSPIFNKHMDIFGVYPEGILIGLLDCEMRDMKYRKNNAYDFYTQMLLLARTYMETTIKPLSYGYAYRYYLEIIPDFFAIKKVIESGITIEELRSSDIEVPSDTEYLFKDKDNFLKAINSYNYEKIYKYWRTVPQIVFSEKPKIIHNSTDDVNKESEKEVVDSMNNNVNSDKEFHVFLYNPLVEDEDFEEAALCTDYKTTKMQLDIPADIILTTNLHFVSADLIRKGYRIFVHIDKDTVNEMKIGSNDWTDKDIKYTHNFEKLIYGYMLDQ